MGYDNHYDYCPIWPIRMVRYVHSTTVEFMILPHEKVDAVPVSGFDLLVNVVACPVVVISADLRKPPYASNRNTYQ